MRTTSKLLLALLCTTTLSTVAGAQTIATVGGSLTNRALEGRETLGPSPFWTDTRWMAGGHLHNWLDNPFYLEVFTQELQANPAITTVWWQILFDPHPARNITPKDRDAAIFVASRIRSLCPGCQIVVSPMPDFWPRGICSNTGGSAYEVSVLLAIALVERGLVDSLGPSMSPITPLNYNGTNDPCHQGPVGQVEHGSYLEQFGW